LGIKTLRALTTRLGLLKKHSTSPAIPIQPRARSRQHAALLQPISGSQLPDQLSSTGSLGSFQEVSELRCCQRYSGAGLVPSHTPKEFQIEIERLLCSAYPKTPFGEDGAAFISHALREGGDVCKMFLSAYPDGILGSKFNESGRQFTAQRLLPSGSSPRWRRL
jgi:hypothetical protein